MSWYRASPRNRLSGRGSWRPCCMMRWKMRFQRVSLNSLERDRGSVVHGRDDRETTDVWILPHVDGWCQVRRAVCGFAAHEQDYAAAYEIADLHLGDHSPRPRTSSPWVPATLGGCAAFLPGA